ncbi:MAG: MarR family winged helix-turn-helix transcriptional regulator, partial [Solirubrobacteraceae bacterium]
RLAEHGLAERRHDGADRRSVTVSLTPKARELVSQVRRAYEASVADLIRVFDDDELATLLRLVEKLAAEPPAPATAHPAPIATA